MMKPPKFMMNAELSVKKLLGEGPYGPEYDDPIKVDAYIEPKRRKVTDNEGNEVIAEVFAVVRDEIEIPIDSKANWPWSGRDADYKILKAIPYRPMGKYSHTEVYMK